MSDARDDMVAQLAEITQQGNNACRHTLEAAGWDLERAMELMLLASPTPTPTPTPLDARPARRAEARDVLPGRQPATANGSAFGASDNPTVGLLDMALRGAQAMFPPAGGHGPLGSGSGSGPRAAAGLSDNDDALQRALHESLASKDHVMPARSDVTGAASGARGGGSFGGGGGGGGGGGSSDAASATPGPDNSELQRAIRASLQDAVHDTPSPAAAPVASLDAPGASDAVTELEADLQRALRLSLADSSSGASPQPPAEIPQQLPPPPPPAAAAAAADSAGASGAQAEPQITLKIHYKEEVPFYVQLPLNSTLRDVSAVLSCKTGVEASRVELLGWPTAAEPTPDMALTKLVPPSERTQPVALFLVTGDAPSPRTTSPVPMDVCTSDDDDLMAAEADPSPRKLEPLVSDGDMDPAAFAAAFERRYGALRPLFFEGELAEALEESARSCKPLLVYLHDDVSIETNVFCSHVLTNAAVLAKMTEHYVVWGWDTSTAFGTARLNAMSASASGALAHLPQRRPLLAVFVRAGATTRCVRVLEGYMYSEELEDALVTTALQQTAVFEEERQTQLLAAERRLELDRQNQAYEESLRADRLKAEQQREQELQARREQEEQERQAELLAAQHASLKASIPPEPPADAKAGVTTFQFRLPDGKRLNRRFSSSDRVEVLGLFVQSEGFAGDKYLLAMTHPRRVVSNDFDQKATLEDAGLTGRQVMYVEEILE